MTNVIDRQVEELRSKIDAVEIESLERLKYRVSDAIREGSTVSDQAFAWNKGDKMCALSAAIVAAKARDYL